jgi:hypothetical protein
MSTILRFKKIGPASELCSSTEVGNYTSSRTKTSRKCLLTKDTKDFVFLSEKTFGNDLGKAFKEGIVYKIVDQDTLVVSTSGITIETLAKELGA